MYNEAKDAEHSWFENVEGGLELMSERARLKLKSAAKRVTRKARRAEKKVRAMTNQLRSTPNKDVVGNEDENDDEEEEMEDDGTPDLGNMRLSLSGKVRPHALARSKNLAPSSPNDSTSTATRFGDKFIIHSPDYNRTDADLGSDEDTDESGGGHEDSSYHVVGQGGKVLHGEAARRLSLGSGARGSQSAPASRNTSELKTGSWNWKLEELELEIILF